MSRFFYLLAALAVSAVAGARRGNVRAIAECLSWVRGTGVVLVAGGGPRPDALMGF